MNRQAEHDIRRKTKVLEHVVQSGNISHTCRKYGVSRDAFYRWKRQLESGDPNALINSKPCPQNPKIRVSEEIEKKILSVRQEFVLGQLRISWYLKRYYGITVSPNGVYGVLNRQKHNQARGVLIILCQFSKLEQMIMRRIGDDRQIQL